MLGSMLLSWSSLRYFSSRFGQFSDHKLRRYDLREFKTPGNNDLWSFTCCCLFLTSHPFFLLFFVLCFPCVLSFNPPFAHQSFRKSSMSFDQARTTCFVNTAPEEESSWLLLDFICSRWCVTVNFVWNFLFTITTERRKIIWKVWMELRCFFLLNFFLSTHFPFFSLQGLTLDLQWEKFLSNSTTNQR